MKKNISINISGIIFHIEEDGYETLRKYLDSITRYFSTFEDSNEIMADIESRIAEIFLSKLNEGKQVITLEDVNGLITTMGSVSDFKAAEEQGFAKSDSASAGASEGTEGSSQSYSYKGAYSSYSGPKQLVRDQQRKILGGVCAGLANYMNVDIVWIRLLFAILAFAWGFTIFVYIIMWIVVPGSYDLNEVELGKKMYRDPERKVLGGVSGGLASYLNIDILAVRILFILLTVAGGLGIFVYIILWVILPEARTITDRMQMQGEPVTLSNIESTIKKNQSLNPDPEESTLTKVLLFPFRLIAIILSGLAKILVPLVDVIRVVIGIIIVGVGLALAFSFLISGGILLGLFSGTALNTPLIFGYEELSLQRS
jgi:phage shock protein PspC (stress-responsive transcriptional regulator)